MEFVTKELKGENAFAIYKKGNEYAGESLIIVKKNIPNAERTCRMILKMQESQNLAELLAAVDEIDFVDGKRDEKSPLAKKVWEIKTFIEHGDKKDEEMVEVMLLPTVNNCTITGFKPKFHKIPISLAKKHGLVE